MTRRWMCSMEIYREKEKEANAFRVISLYFSFPRGNAQREIMRERICLAPFPHQGRKDIMRFTPQHKSAWENGYEIGFDEKIKD